jgi:hypothetical protein
MYKLKPGIEAFTVVDGPFAKHDFKPGRVYDDIPPQEAKKFEEIIEETQEPKAPRSTKKAKNAF